MSARAHRGTWPRAARTSDGVEYHIRPIRADDAGRERDFLLRLSPQSRYQRLMNAVSEPSAQLIEQLVVVDYHRSMALVAVVLENGKECMIGAARYAADADGLDCEFAVAVADDWQCRGIAATLAGLLFEYAAAEGLRSIYAIVLADNSRMLELAQWLGLELEAPVMGYATRRASRRLDGLVA